MSNNITTLILNLLISENKLHRIRIANKIVGVLETTVGDFGEIETRMRKHFLSRIMACVENPSGQSREALFEIANFYKISYIEYIPEFLAAA